MRGQRMPIHNIWDAPTSSPKPVSPSVAMSREPRPWRRCAACGQDATTGVRSYSSRRQCPSLTTSQTSIPRHRDDMCPTPPPATACWGSCTQHTATPKRPLIILSTRSRSTLSCGTPLPASATLAPSSAPTTFSRSRPICFLPFLPQTASSPG